MNKFIWLFGVFIYSAQSIAETEPDTFSYKAPCTKLNITIENHTQSVCHLIQKDIENGIVISKERFEQIPVGESRSLRVLEKESLFGGPTVTLFYVCGNGTVGLRNDKQSCLFGHAVTASIVSISDMYAQYQLTHTSVLPAVRGSIVWTLSQEGSK